MTTTVITDPQLAKLGEKWQQSNQGISFSDFLKGVQPTIGSTKAVTVEWCGMWLWIEADGTSTS